MIDEGQGGWGLMIPEQRAQKGRAGGIGAHGEQRQAHKGQRNDRDTAGHG